MSRACQPARSLDPVPVLMALALGLPLTAADALPMTLASLLEGDPQGGFVLVAFNGRTVSDVPLTRIQRQGNRLTVAASAQPGPVFTFTLRESPRHLALTLDSFTGDASDRSFSLAFRVKTTAGALTAPIDYLGVDASNGSKIDLRWPYLWNTNPQDPKGGFAIARKGTDAENDRALAEIWTQEPIPHPAIGRPWTEAEVQTWIGRYHDTFHGLTSINLNAEDAQQLATLTSTIQAMGAKRIYLHTDTWRYDYWPVANAFTTVNPHVFPGGRADLVAYSRQIHAQGMQLQLHNVSGGIGRRDREFITPTGVDPRLESWFHGTLLTDLGPKDREVLVRPAPGVTCPHVRLEQFWDLGFFSVAGEVLRISDILDSDGPTWRLVLEGRGRDGTTETPHPAGTPVTGFLSAYRQNYVPDPQSDLLGIMAERYAGLINEASLDHQHYDGAEIHRSQYPWGLAKFTALVAARIDHPTTTSTSGGRPSPWNFEQRFSTIAAMPEIGYWSVHLPLLLAGQRNASSWLDAHFEANSKILNGARRISLGKPEPMFGLNCEAMSHHGLFPRLQGLFAAWGRLLPHLDPLDADYLRTFLKPVASPLVQRGSHYQGRDVLVLEDRPQGPVLVPTRVLAREDLDAPWRLGQEFGPIAPRQYLVPGDTLTLPNPNPGQTPGLILHVLPAIDAAGKSNAEPVSPQDKAKRDQLDNYIAGTRIPAPQAESPAGTQSGRDGLWPTKNTAAGQTTLAVTPETVTIRGENTSNKPYWTETELPEWPIKLPLNGRRAIQMTIDGDGSGAILVLQLESGGVRDYVVKIDFSGRRTITIPNGEVAWSQGCWGWRFDAKNFDYQGIVRRARLGFAHLPAKTTATVTLQALSVPATQAVPLEDPVIHCGDGTLSIRGQVASDEYLTYETGDGARVFDRNWNLLRTLPAVAQGFTAGAEVPFQVTHAGTGPQPWLEAQVITRGEPQVMATKP